MEAKVYNQEGQESGKMELPESVFGLPWNADLVHQVVTAMRSNARQNTAAAKTPGVRRGPVGRGMVPAARQFGAVAVLLTDR